jgi:hypothetical protein
MISFCHPEEREIYSPNTQLEYKQARSLVLRDDKTLSER